MPNLQLKKFIKKCSKNRVGGGHQKMEHVFVFFLLPDILSIKQVFTRERVSSLVPVVEYQRQSRHDHSIDSQKLVLLLSKIGQNNSLLRYSRGCTYMSWVTIRKTFVGSTLTFTGTLWFDLKFDFGISQLMCYRLEIWYPL